jgi:polyhydroxyalkanoate synthesis regulator protein
MSNIFDDKRYILIDTKTGEEVDIQVFFEEVKKSGWEITYAKMLADYIGCTGSSSAAVLAHIIASRRDGNLIMETQDEIIQATGKGEQTVKKVFKVLLQKGLLKKIRNGKYMLSPKIIRNGDTWKGAAMLKIWGEL